MPKRKRGDSISYIRKKIKKLEKKLLKGCRRSSSSSEQSSSEPQDDKFMDLENPAYPVVDLDEPVPSTSASNIPEVTQEPPPQSTAVEAGIIEIEDHQPDLDETVLQILGTDPLTTTSFGKDIQKDLATRYEHKATSGLTKELRKELLESHLPPANCKLIDAPSLNPEIKAAVTDVIVKRDKAMQAKQKQLGSAIACLSEAITILLSKETKDPNILKLLVDAGRILCDCQHNDSITRRNFILAVLKKELKDQMQLTKIDNLLFGQELADTLKTAKAINRSGAELKSVPLPKPSSKPRPPPSTRNLNWKAPAPNRRPTGPRIAKESAPSTKQQHAHSSRGSRPSSSRSRQ
ncbi:hypothetical protein B5X24_HaOG205776 [Helicoverpa armigera]|uniref:Uncharacterized protein n=2 Tax=Helicoverpa armigera TaxID=29058 RepID=A0A2W1BSD9_HELAM|nr:hypothetical protein B5X24_HaOG205776 [Helicoverpa armigera]